MERERERAGEREWVHEWRLNKSRTKEVKWLFGTFSDSWFWRFVCFNVVSRKVMKATTKHQTYKTQYHSWFSLVLIIYRDILTVVLMLKWPLIHEITMIHALSVQKKELFSIVTLLDNTKTRLTDEIILIYLSLLKVPWSKKLKSYVFFLWKWSYKQKVLTKNIYK